jgi:flagellar hook-associated protein 1 FlgK
MAVFQKQMDVTSHNISNATTAGYSRQTVGLGTCSSDYSTDGYFGTGVQIEDITRARNELTDKQIRYYNQSYSANNEKSTLLSQVESLVSESSGTGLSSMISDFFNTWTKLSVTPTSTQLRNAVVQSAQSLTGKIQEIYDGTNEARTQSKNEAVQNVTAINSAVKNITDLNKQILAAQATGSSPNDLLDARDKAISDLSQIVNINTSVDDKGCVAVSIGGILASDNVISTEFKVKENNGQLSLVTSKDEINATVNGGKLSAEMDVYSGSIPEYQSKLDDISQTLMNSVNFLHRSGTDLNGDAGEDFFSSYSNGVLAVNQDITDNVNKLAISSDGTNGNGDISKKMGELADIALLNGKTLSDNYSDLVSKIGSDVKYTAENAASTKLVIDKLQDQQDSFSGVSVDEEMTNIIVFQRSYAASAKMIKAADEMLQTLLSMVS